MNEIEVEGKGRGVATAEGIRKGEFVLEYKYNESYGRDKCPQHEDEYATNDSFLRHYCPQGSGYALTPHAIMAHLGGYSIMIVLYQQTLICTLHYW